MDGESILPCFDGRVADEMRLWQAVERQYLVTFDYCGVFDWTELKTWYEPNGLVAGWSFSASLRNRELLGAEKTGSIIR